MKRTASHRRSRTSIRVPSIIPVFRNRMMRAQARVKQSVKPLIFRDEVRLRPVRYGPGRGTRLHLNRRVDLQREFGLWESELHGIYRKHISASSVVYDIGAADGLTALTFATLARTGHVYAFEPVSAVLAALERNLEANPSMRGRVTIVRNAAGPAGEMSLDAFAKRAGTPAPDFVKIDVDGAELGVLEGMDRLAKQDRPTVVVEVHSPKLEDGCALWLAERDYSVSVVRNAWWRTLYPELRPIGHNRWLLAVSERQRPLPSPRQRVS